MGSGQSAPIQSAQPQAASTANETATSGESAPRKKRQPPLHLSGPKLVEFKCRKKKREWTTCLGSWYDQRFLPGKALEEEQADCDDLFERFKECYMRNMLKEREKKGLGPPKGDTMLAEFLEDEGISPSDKQ
mmetsp:Transcript_133942/g.199199  ORF Transcript_133942/g.199199 Transcript_133942/m.199199 type:complete len:132 (-) Transcript_133942:126-521(-)